MSLKERIDKYPALKQFVHRLMVPRHQARPRLWVSWLVNPLVHKQHRTAIVRSSVRMDVLPSNPFSLGARSVIDDFCVVNNGVGEVSIGENSLIGIGSVVIGPVSIGSNVIMAQHVVLSGLNHSYEDIHVPIRDQAVTTNPIVVEDDCWIGANVTITAGVTVGRHAVIAGGSVVTKDVPAYSVVGGNPARVLKKYDEATAQWVKNTEMLGAAARPMATIG